MPKSFQKTIYAWGRIASSTSTVVEASGREFPKVESEEQSYLPYGLGRSYGDSCLNSDEGIIAMRGLNKFISFDREEGVLCCEAGVSLDEILKVIVVNGWFLPTTPGTKYITLGGAVANDVHGKNHHRSGSFGNSVLSFTLKRSDGKSLRCSREENTDWFAATVGGLGLTGVIVDVTIKLQKIESSFVSVETIPFANLDEFFKLSAELDSEFEHTVSWIDCLAKGDKLGRGIYMGGNYTDGQSQLLSVHSQPKVSLPLSAPGFLLSPFNIKIFNTLYYALQKFKRGKKLMHYDSFFYPLDKLGGWNKLYGKSGFYQYQSVIPHAHAQEATRKMLTEIADAKQGSFLAVLKTFGEEEAEGMLSFCQPGVTLALDFPNGGKKTLELFDRLDQIVNEAGGILYPAKDARMPAESFATYYPNLEQFSMYVDPACSSDFWRRCMLNLVK